MFKTLSPAAFALALACGAASANDGGNGCHERALNGLYLFSASGFTTINGVLQPKAIAELIRFNGDGTVSVPPGGATVSIAGNVMRSPGGAGTYTVNADCIGTLAFANGPQFDIFVAPRGDDLWMVQTNPGNVFQGNVTRIGR